MNIKFKGTRWTDKVIIVANLLDVYNVYIIKLSNEKYENRSKVSNPVQKLKKHGDLQKIVILNLRNKVYGLFASTYGVENR